MRKPELIWIGPFPFDIYFDHVKLALSTTNDGVSKAVGATNSDMLEIIVDERLPESRQRDVLIHEVFHAIWSFAALRNAEEMTEELVIDSLTAPWLYVLRVNPDFVDYLIAGSVSDTPETRTKLAIYALLADEEGEGSAEEGEGS